MNQTRPHSKDPTTTKRLSFFTSFPNTLSFILVIVFSYSHLRKPPRPDPETELHLDTYYRTLDVAHEISIVAAIGRTSIISPVRIRHRPRIVVSTIAAVVAVTITC